MAPICSSALYQHHSNFDCYAFPIPQNHRFLIERNRMWTRIVDASFATNSSRANRRCLRKSRRDPGYSSPAALDGPTSAARGRGALKPAVPDSRVSRGLRTQCFEGFRAGLRCVICRKQTECTKPFIRERSHQYPLKETAVEQGVLTTAHRRVGGVRRLPCASMIKSSKTPKT